MKKLQLNNAEFSIPSSWNELSTSQLLALASMDLKGGMTVEEIKIKMLLLAMEAHVTHYKKHGFYTLVCRKNKYDLTSAEILAMASIFDFLFEETENGTVLRSRLTKNPFPILPCKCSTRLHGPEDGLQDLTYEQAIEAESFLHRFSYTKDPQDFYVFVSALHRTGKKFDIEKLAPNAKHVAHASPNTLHIVYLFWCGCMDAIARSYPNCFSGEDKTTPQKKPFETHREIIYRLADGDITKETAIEKLEIHRIYDVLNRKIEDDEKLREDFKKLQRR